jgi:hypothetical protein
MHALVIAEPTAFDMLKPTLERYGQRPVLRDPWTGRLAIVPLREAVTFRELEGACAMHCALERGLLVLV